MNSNPQTKKIKIIKKTASVEPPATVETQPATVETQPATVETQPATVEPQTPKIKNMNPVENSKIISPVKTIEPDMGIDITDFADIVNIPTHPIWYYKGDETPSKNHPIGEKII